jgi:hypothetical protein
MSEDTWTINQIAIVTSAIAGLAIWLGGSRLLSRVPDKYFSIALTGCITASLACLAIFGLLVRGVGGVEWISCLLGVVAGFLLLSISYLLNAPEDIPATPKRSRRTRSRHTRSRRGPHIMSARSALTASLIIFAAVLLGFYFHSTKEYNSFSGGAIAGFLIFHWIRDIIDLLEEKAR